MNNKVETAYLLRICLAISVFAATPISPSLAVELARQTDTALSEIKSSQSEPLIITQPPKLFAQAPTKSESQPQSSPTTEEPQVLITEVVVTGVDEKLKKVVYDVIRTKPGQTITKSQLQKDINTIFETGFFSNVSAVPEDTPLGVRVTFKVEPIQTWRVSEVVVLGVEGKLHNVVYNVIRTKAGQTTNINQLREDYASILQTGNFADVDFSHKDTPNGVQIIFNVKPNPILQVVNIKGNQAIPQDLINKTLNQLREQYGKPLNTNLIIEAQQKISSWYHKNGYDPKIDIDWDRKKDGIVTLNIKEGNILEDVQVRILNKQGKLISVDNYSSLKKALQGSIFNEQKISNAIDQAYESGAYSYKDVALKSGENSNQVILVVHLIENAVVERTLYKGSQLVDKGTLNSLKQGIAKYQEALALLQKVDAQPGEFNLEAVKKTIDSFGPYSKELWSSTIPPSYSKHELEARALSNIANIHVLLGEFRDALAYYNKARSIFQSLKASTEEALVIDQIAELYKTLGDIQRTNNTNEQLLEVLLKNLEALRKEFQQSEKQRALEPLESDPTETLLQISRYTESGDFERDLLLGRQSAIDNVLRKRSSPTNEASTQNLKKPLPSEILLQVIQNGGKVSESEASWLMLNASNYVDRGDFQGAFERFYAALKVFQTLGAVASEAETLTRAAKAYYRKGDEKQALEYYERALKRWHVAGYRRSTALGGFFPFYSNETEVKLLAYIAKVYERLGKNQQALEYYNQALLADASAPLGSYERSLLLVIAQTYNQLGQPKQALEKLNLALPIFQATKDQSSEAAALSLKANIYYNSLNDPQQAIADLNQALLSLQDSDAKSDLKGYIHFFLGALYTNQKQFQQAFEHLEMSLQLFRTVGKRVGELEAYKFEGFAYENSGNIEQAISTYISAAKVMESIRGNIQVEELATSYASSQINVYERLINLLWNAKRYPEVFEYVERAKAKAFLDQLASGRINFRKGVDSKMLQREQEVRLEITSLRKQLFTLHNQPINEWDRLTIQETEKKLTKQEEIYEELLTEIKTQSPQTASLISADIAPLAKIQQQLNSDTALVEYFVTEKRTFAFVITRNGFQPIPIDVSRKQLTKKITLFRDFADLSEPNSTELQQLHKWLIEPLKPYLANSQHLIIVPHGILHYLPFAALNDGNSYLIDSYTLSNLPSANVLGFLHPMHQSEKKTVLALGNPAISDSLPPLNHAQAEVKAIARSFKTLPLMGSDATESIVRSQAGQFNILHLSVHGEFNPINPLFSTLYLAADSQNDGRLEVNEIYGLDLTAATNLVVLSACQTNIGELSQGDEVVGLNRAFLYAGTPAIVSSLWNIDDRATEILMERFYSHLQAGMDISKALQQAQLEVRKDPHYSYAHPYFWAAFSLTGS